MNVRRLRLDLVVAGVARHTCVVHFTTDYPVAVFRVPAGIAKPEEAIEVIAALLPDPPAPAAPETLPDFFSDK